MDEPVAHLVSQLSALPGVRAIALGGSRATGDERPDSDWDLGVYYRGGFDPELVRALGHPGEVSELGGWGGGVFNGGAWLQVGGIPVDLHWRDLDAVEREIADAEAGRMHIEPLAFHLAGIPGYLLLAELAIARVLTGELPRPAFPPALQRSAPAVWSGNARMHVAYARSHASAGRLAQCTATLTVAALQTAHAVLAARGEWVTNEKRLLDRARLRSIDGIVADAAPDPTALLATCDRVEALCAPVWDAA
ncbi:nucleotidyltransferase domain-containing protein [Leifsonia sp. C5G2]|uniref:nucleotidyltransferase family protein n=1 Tax=Leifsonia sp. C5G2 TaxID=2735269 RepID=UPI001584BEC5|nr:nucleotidyltransferase domain-containing protein [Leifsonia sp. C5G2]NUU06096.1 nucleotidyltransferase domain-containing protein [Leifsonia sp. C5G2]